MSKTRVKTAVVGIGRWGKNIAQELAEVSDLTAYASGGNEGNIAWVKEHLPGVLGMDIHEIANDPSIDAVAIATPISTHARLVESFLSMGKHVFVEKPLAETSTEAGRLAGLALAKDRVLATGYLFLHHPAYTELKRRIAGRPVTSVTLNWDKYGTFAEPIELNLLTHHLAISLDLLGMPERGVLVRGDGIESRCDQVEARLFYPAKEVTSKINRASKESRHEITVTCADGSVFAWVGAQLLEDGQLAFTSDDEPLQLEIQSFLGAVDGTLARPDPAFGAKVLELHELLSS